MKLSEEQTQLLLELIASTMPDKMGCDGCIDHLAELVDSELLGKSLPEALTQVKVHLSQCPCCSDEHSALMESLIALEC